MLFRPFSLIVLLTFPVTTWQIAAAQPPLLEAPEEEDIPDSAPVLIDEGAGSLGDDSLSDDAGAVPGLPIPESTLPQSISPNLDESSPDAGSQDPGPYPLGTGIVIPGPISPQAGPTNRLRGSQQVAPAPGRSNGRSSSANGRSSRGGNATVQPEPQALTAVPATPADILNTQIEQLRELIATRFALGQVGQSMGTAATRLQTLAVQAVVKGQQPWGIGPAQMHLDRCRMLLDQLNEQADFAPVDNTLELHGIHSQQPEFVLPEGVNGYTYIPNPDVPRYATNPDDVATLRSLLDSVAESLGVVEEQIANGELLAPGLPAGRSPAGGHDPHWPAGVAPAEVWYGPSGPHCHGVRPSWSVPWSSPFGGSSGGYPPGYLPYGAGPYYGEPGLVRPPYSTLK